MSNPTYQIKSTLKKRKKGQHVRTKVCIAFQLILFDLLVENNSWPLSQYNSVSSKSLESLKVHWYTSD